MRSKRDDESDDLSLWKRLKAMLNRIFKDERVELDTSLNYDHKPMKRFGLLVVVLVFGGFGSWAILAPIEGASVASGVVVVSSYRQTVQHLEGGLVNEINVREGEHVKKGDRLIVLDGTQWNAQLDITKSQYYLALATEARLLAERDGLSTVHYPTELHSQVKKVIEAKNSQNLMFKTRHDALDGERKVLKQRIEQLVAQRHGLEKLHDNKIALVTSYNEEVAGLIALLDEGFTDKLYLRDLQRSSLRLQGEIAENASAIARINIQVGETQLQLLQLDKNLQTSVASELSQIQASVFDLQEQVKVLHDRVTRSIIRSPSDGVVLGIQVHTIGAIISPGQPVLDVVPQSSELVVEAQVNPVDIDRVSKGQTAQVRFSAFNSNTLPIIKGRVESISADRLINPTNGLPYFLARVSIPNNELTKLNGEELHAGMPAEVFILSGSRTFAQYITKTITDGVSRSLTEG